MSTTMDSLGNGWRPVADAPTNDEVLVCLDAGGIIGEIVTLGHCCSDSEDENWCVLIEESWVAMSSKEIDGWQPKPAPPKVPVAPPALPQILDMLNGALNGTAAHMSLTMLPGEAHNVRTLLPEGEFTEGVTGALGGTGFDMRTAATQTIGNLTLVATHRRPATGAEVTAAADRRAKTQAGVIAPELLVGLGSVGAILGVALSLRGIIGAPIGGLVLLALCALLAVVGARLTQTPPPVKVPVLPEQAAALCLQVEVPEAVPVHLGRKRARRASGHMVSELAWGIGGAGVVLLACAALLSFLGVQ